MQFLQLTTDSGAKADEMVRAKIEAVFRKEGADFAVVLAGGLEVVDVMREGGLVVGVDEGGSEEVQGEGSVSPVHVLSSVADGAYCLLTDRLMCRC